MNVSTTQPFQIIYSLYNHEFLGYLFEAYVVQVDGRGKLTFKHQHISVENAADFKEGLDETDFKLIALMDDLRQDTIVKKHNPSGKKIAVGDFFLKVFDKTKGDKLLQEQLENYVEAKKNAIIAIIDDKMLFEMGSDGEPTHRKITIMKDKCTVLFHFRRNEDNTHYFPTIKFQGELIKFQYKNAIIINNKPARLLLEGKLYSFEKEVDGKKLKPFLNKNFIDIPRKVEETYYQKFVTQLIASFDVYAKGFEIKTDHLQAKPIITISELQTVQQPVMSLFGGEDTNTVTEIDDKIIFELSFDYGKYNFSASNAVPATVEMEKTEESYIFHKVKRKMQWEKECILLLDQLGLKLRNAKCTLPKTEAFQWISDNTVSLLEDNFEIKQNILHGKRYFIGISSISLDIKENHDWFDVKAIVKFGDYAIPFSRIRRYIVQKKKEFELPNGEIAVIPEEWFTKYSSLFAFMDSDEETLKKHHIALVQELQNGNLAQVTMNNKLKQLHHFEDIEDYPLPINFKGQLRPYQKAGYNWMLFLKHFNFGGCLADDMGLGKTIQTLAVLQYEKETGNQGASLLIMPTSLLYNWRTEAKKFAPELRVLVYSGINRVKRADLFAQYDIVLTSYGTARIDMEILEKYHFNYLILDESQAIKNPSSQIAKEVVRLHARNKLVLSGTPIENSTMDLWSQLSFVNPGLLGTQAFFREFFQVPIEKQQSVEKMKKLHALIKPFVLRRHKSQVATELPAKVENIRICNMTEEQSSIYEKEKSAIRNEILDVIDQTSVNKSQMLILRGLTKLRQIANHPRMCDETYQGNSGKLEEVIEMIQNAVNNGSKILIFSSFVKHLAIVKDYLQKQHIKYCYLDGSTKDREEQVNNFQNNEEIPIFLISLKAGGVGLNLTAADTVFVLDPWWNPAAEAQAIDRAHRIGQKRTVFIYKFISSNTVEEKILALQQSKLKLSQDLITIEENFVKSLTRNDIAAIFE